MDYSIKLLQIYSGWLSLFRSVHQYHLNDRPPRMEAFRQTLSLLDTALCVTMLHLLLHICLSFGGSCYLRLQRGGVIPIYTHKDTDNILV